MDFDRIITSRPVNSQAARQLGGGEHFVAKVEFTDYFADRPPLRPVTPEMRIDPNFVDFTGQQFGRLTVVGLRERDGGRGSAIDDKARWVCRCQCGAYCQRTSKALRGAARGGNSFVPLCGSCEYTRRLREQSLKGMKNDPGPNVSIASGGRNG